MTAAYSTLKLTVKHKTSPLRAFCFELQISLERITVIVFHSEVQYDCSVSQSNQINVSGHVPRLSSLQGRLAGAARLLAKEQISTKSSPILDE